MKLRARPAAALPAPPPPPAGLAPSTPGAVVSSPRAEGGGAGQRDYDSRRLAGARAGRAGGGAGTAPVLIATRVCRQSPGGRRRLSACGSERQRAGGGAAPGDEARSSHAGRSPGRSRARGAAGALQPRAGTGQEPLRPGRRAGSAAVGSGCGHPLRVRARGVCEGSCSPGQGGFRVTLGHTVLSFSDPAP